MRNGWLLLVVCGLLVVPASAAATGGPAGTIAYSGGSGIQTIWADGSHAASLGSVASDPSWSPDGKQIVFTSDRDGEDAIYVMIADGTGVRRISPPGLRALSPEWGRTGQIVFWGQGPSSSGLFIVDPNGSGLREVSNTGAGTQPSLSPDGTKIAFTDLAGYGPGDESIDVIHTDGSGLSRVAHGWAPAWSPDGTHLAYLGAVANKNPELVLSAPDGSAATALTQVGSCVTPQAPTWSPDGKWLAYESCPSQAGAQLYVIASSGGTPTRIALDARADGGPDWQPLSTPTSPGVATVGSVRLAYPGRFDSHDFSSCSYAVTGVRKACVRGVVVASYHLLSDPEIGGNGASFPANGVALELYRAPRQPDVIARSARLPFSLADFHSVGRGMNPSTEQRELFFRVDGANYWATAWVGKHSSRPDRLALASLISTIRTR